MYILIKFEFEFEKTGSTLVSAANAKSIASVLTLDVVTCNSGSWFLLVPDSVYIQVSECGVFIFRFRNHGYCAINSS